MTEKKPGPLERDAIQYAADHTPAECAVAADKLVLISADAMAASGVLKRAGNANEGEKK